MKLEIRWITVLFMASAPFFGAGGCGGGRIAIGGDSDQAGTAGSDGDTGTSQGGRSSGAGSAGRAGAGSSAGMAASGASGATGVSGATGFSGSVGQCADEEGTVRTFIANNKSCVRTSDCMDAIAGCGVTEDGCTGAVYVNVDTDIDEFESRMAVLASCEHGGSCGSCLRTVSAPECVDGTCRRAFAPPSQCLLPFVAGTCEANIQVWAFVDGSCVERRYGGCGGNDNRFFTQEECLLRCEGAPDPNPCPPDRVPRATSLSCTSTGSWPEQPIVCAKTCVDDTECDHAGMRCFAGFCQLACL